MTARKLVWACLAVLVGCAAGALIVALFGDSQRAGGRLDALERQVAALQAQAASAIGGSGATAPKDYVIGCPAPWQELGPVGGGLWGCRTPEPLADGFYPNCNLTASRMQAGLTAQAYFESATAASPQLSAAKQFGGHAVALSHQAAYEASFEHAITGARLRVLATVVVRDDQAFAITCSAPPALFESLLPRFREIAHSFALGV